MKNYELEVGDVLGDRFSVERMIGAGGFGSVWLAYDFAVGRRVALKVLHASRATRRDVRIRFAREADLLARFRHRNIPRAIAFDTGSDFPFIAMEIAEGRSLAAIIEERASAEQRFGAGEVRLVFTEVCEAIAAAHHRDVVHRDIKPGNVVVARLDEVECALKLVDFGIARVVDTDAEQATTVGRLLGSPLHAAPEQLEGVGVDARSDIFALGVLLFELLTLSQPFILDDRGHPLLLSPERIRKLSPAEVLAVRERILFAPRPRASAHRPAISPGLDALIARSMAIVPAERPESVLALLGEAMPLLVELAQQETVLRPRLRANSRPRFEVPRPASSPRRDWSSALLASGALLMVLVFRDSAPDPAPIEVIAVHTTAAPRIVDAQVAPEIDLPQSASMRRAPERRGAPTDCLEALSSRLRAAHDDAQALTDLSEEIIAASARLSDESRSSAIARLARNGAITLDSTLLEAAIAKLRIAAQSGRFEREWSSRCSSSRS